MTVILHLLPDFCHMTLHSFLHAFSSVGAVFFEVSVSTIPSPTLVHRRKSPSDEEVCCADVCPPMAGGALDPWATLWRIGIDGRSTTSSNGSMCDASR